MPVGDQYGRTRGASKIGGYAEKNEDTEEEG